MYKCPRCNLPQKGIIKCQYCGCDFTKYNKKHTKIIGQRLKDIIGGFKKSQIVSRNIKSKVHSVSSVGKSFRRTHDGGARSGTDRRKRKYKTFIPERRSGVDRRK
jgi:hypothetical protein